MAGEIRYRSGVDARTGQILRGPAHLEQSLQTIWNTRIDTRLMRLAFGSDLRSLLAEDLTPTIAMLAYNEMIASAARWEPEAMITELQLVRLTDGGALGLRHGGLYFPEGRLGNFDIAIPFGSAGTGSATVIGG